MIWVVSDRQETREALVSLVAGMSYEAAGIECGDEVIKRMQFVSPVLVIVDCGIPESFELIGKIRSHPRPTGISIVMFSTDDQNLRERALMMGADAYVPKGSLDWAELLEEVRRFVGPPGRK